MKKSVFILFFVALVSAGCNQGSSTEDSTATGTTNNASDARTEVHNAVVIESPAEAQAKPEIIIETDAGDAAEVIRASLAKRLPRLVPDSIQPAGFAGLYEVAFGTRVIYVTEDGRHLLQGKVIDLLTGSQITEERLQTLKLGLLSSLSEENMIVYGDENARHTVTVFTDIDCGYCRKLHSEMDKYNEKGIRIRYLAYPRAGLMSQSARDIASVWCADDRHAAMDIAKSGGKVESRDCESPVAEHYQLGQDFGISGTPALILGNGEVVPGYVPAARLAEALDQQFPQPVK